MRAGGDGVPPKLVRPPTPRLARPHPLSTDRAAPTRRGAGSCGRSWRSGCRWLWACLAAIWWLSPGPARLQLPATPRAWLDAYEAAAIDNPSRVCSELFAPQLAQAYGKALHGSCTSYFKQITSFSVVVRRVLQDGGTAVLELRQTVRPRDWAVVLNREPGGWRAVDLLAGELVR